jgi:hypothetical protein
LFGFIRDLVGHYKVLFTYACITFALAAISLLFVRHGEDKVESVNASQVFESLDD